MRFLHTLLLALSVAILGVSAGLDAPNRESGEGEKLSRDDRRAKKAARRAFKKILKGLKGKMDRALVKKLKKNSEPDQEGDWCKGLCEEDPGNEECQKCCIAVNHRVDWFCNDPQNEKQAECCTNWTAECYNVDGENNNQHACKKCYGYGGYGRSYGGYGGYRRGGYGYGRRMEAEEEGRGYGGYGRGYGRRMERPPAIGPQKWGRRMEEEEEGRGYGGYGRGGRRMEEEEEEGRGYGYGGYGRGYGRRMEEEEGRGYGYGGYGRSYGRRMEEEEGRGYGGYGRGYGGYGRGRRMEE